jgi:hypothetical protein
MSAPRLHILVGLPRARPGSNPAQALMPKTIERVWAPLYANRRTNTSTTCHAARSWMFSQLSRGHCPDPCTCDGRSGRQLCRHAAVVTKPDRWRSSATMGPTPGMLINRRQTWSWRAVSRTRLSMMATWSRRAAPATSSFQDDRQCGVAGDRVPHLTIPLCAQRGGQKRRTPDPPRAGSPRPCAGKRPPRSPPSMRATRASVPSGGIEAS